MGKHYDRWSSDYDEELRRFFSGAVAAEMRFRSSTGAQLERQRDGTSGGGCMPDTGPPPGVFLTLEKRRPLDAPVILETLRMLSDGHVRALRAHYTPVPPGMTEGMLALDPYAMAAVLSPLAGDVAGHAKEAERVAELRAAEERKAEAESKLEAARAAFVEAEKALSTARERVEVARGRVADLRMVLVREPDARERMVALRRLCKVARDGKREPKAAAAKQIDQAKREAKTLVTAAQRAYAEARAEQRRIRREAEQRRRVAMRGADWTEG